MIPARIVTVVKLNIVSFELTKYKIVYNEQGTANASNDDDDDDDDESGLISTEIYNENEMMQQTVLPVSSQQTRSRTAIEQNYLKWIACYGTKIA